jgi:hypothetical protein
MPHPIFTLLMAALLSAALALPGNRPRRDRICVAVYTFLCCTAGTVAGSWAMYLIHG